MTEFEISQKLQEIRLEELNEALNEVLKHGEPGQNQLANLPDSNPLKALWKRRKKLKDLAEWENDRIMLAKVKEHLENEEKERNK